MADKKLVSLALVLCIFMSTLPVTQAEDDFAASTYVLQEEQPFQEDAVEMILSNPADDTSETQDENFSALNEDSPELFAVSSSEEHENGGEPQAPVTTGQNSPLTGDEQTVNDHHHEIESEMNGTAVSFEQDSMGPYFNPTEEPIAETESELPAEEGEVDLESGVQIEEPTTETDSELPAEEGEVDLEAGVQIEEPTTETDSELPAEEVEAGEADPEYGAVTEEPTAETDSELPAEEVEAEKADSATGVQTEEPVADGESELPAEDVETEKADLESDVQTEKMAADGEGKDPSEEGAAGEAGPEAGTQTEEPVAEESELPAEDVEAEEENLESGVLTEEAASEGEDEVPSEEDASGANDTEESEVTVEDGLPPAEESASPENSDELLLQYLIKLLSDSHVDHPEQVAPIVFRAMKVNGNKLNGYSKSLYDSLKSAVVEIAAGNRESTNISIDFSSLGFEQTSWTMEDLGLAADASSDEIRQAMRQVVDERIQFTKIINSLMTDCPFELFWYDKTASTKSRYGIRITNGTEGKVASVSSYNVQMPVIPSYSATNEANTTTINTETGKAVQTTVTAAKDIVAKYANATDYEKLTGYMKEICALTSYHRVASTIETDTSYGDAYQIIYVFDQNEQTNVVCEGYAKAFQYLCDLTEFDNSSITCYTVTGDLELSENSTSVVGSGKHMWNIVTMEDGQNYLVDVTNSDLWTVGQDGSLFLKGAVSGTPGDHYSYINRRNEEILYTFNTDSGLYDTEELTLSGSDYIAHRHFLQPVSYVEPSCSQPGNIAYWKCPSCGKMYSDEEASQALSVEETVLAPYGHDVVKIDALQPTCTADGHEAYWQ
ncbi:MAG: hypothetical protein IJI38_01890, partial [Clostridia bacterium]|nr:hypothetical protein [Clostridia bacterium]